MARIGVEQSLSDVREALQEKGYDVVDLKNENDSKNLDCCVITGLDSNIMGVSTTFTAGPVIEANGLTADEICNQIESRLSNQQQQQQQQQQ